MVDSHRNWVPCGGVVLQGHGDRNRETTDNVAWLGGGGGFFGVMGWVLINPI